MKYFLQVIFYLLIIFSIFTITIGLKYSESAIQEASSAAVACFFGVMSRIIQAEIHRIEN
jgi:hypothetical protein